MRADHGDGDDGGTGQEREAGDAGLAAVEAPIGAARSFGVDAEEFTVAQALESGVQSRLGRAATGTVDGDGAHGTHKLLRHPPFETGARKVVGLTHEDDLTVEHHRQEHRIPYGIVIGRENGGSFGRNVLLAADPRVIGRLQNGAAGRLKSLIERHCHS